MYVSFLAITHPEKEEAKEQQQQQLVNLLSHPIKLGCVDEDVVLVLVLVMPGQVLYNWIPDTH